MHLNWVKKGIETGSEQCTCSVCGKKIAKYAILVEHPLDKSMELRMHGTCYKKALPVIHQNHYANP